MSVCGHDVVAVACSDGDEDGAIDVRGLSPDGVEVSVTSTKPAAAALWTARTLCEHDHCIGSSTHEGCRLLVSHNHVRRHQTWHGSNSLAAII